MSNYNLTISDAIEYIKRAQRDEGLSRKAAVSYATALYNLTPKQVNRVIAGI